MKQYRPECNLVRLWYQYKLLYAYDSLYDSE